MPVLFKACLCNVKDEYFRSRSLIGITFFLLGIQTLCAQVTYTCGVDVFKACGPNLVVNGNFMDITCPPTTFSTGLTVDCVPITGGPGSFHIGVNAATWNPGWWVATDHSGDGSGFIMGDASPAGDRVLWSQDIVVTAGQTYYFSAYGSNIAGASFNNPRLSFSIDGTPLPDQPMPPRQWQQFCTVWTASASATITIQVVLSRSTGGGHDVAVDDIVFQTVCPVDHCDVEVSDSTSICMGSSTTLNAYAVDAESYSWSPTLGLDDPSVANPIASPIQTTRYVVTMTDIYGCTVKDSIKVTVDPLPFFPFNNTITACLDQPVELNVPLNGVSYLWSTGDTDQNIIVNTGGLYIVSTTLGNCSYTDSVDVILKECCKDNFIPNLITPNGDALNDTFYIGCIDDIPWRLEVYNRWGDRVYYSLDYKNDWSGKGLSDGVYYFFLEKHGRSPYKGWVQIIR